MNNSDFCRKDFFKEMIKRFGKMTLGYSYNMMYLETATTFLSNQRRSTYSFDKNRLWVAQHGKCHWCGIQCIKNGTGGTPNEFTVDHIIPLGSGGTNHWMNLIGSCGKCNNNRGKVWQYISLIYLDKEENLNHQ